MKMIARLTLIAACVAFLGACATQPHVQHTDTATWPHYQRFYWKPVKRAPGAVKNPILDSKILDQRVHKAVAHTLTQRGFTATKTAQDADFIVTYRTSTEQYLQTAQGLRFGFAMGNPFFIDPYWSPFISATYYPIPAIRVRSYDVGYLIIDIIDAHTQTLVWRGWKTAKVTPGNFSQAAVAARVKTILSAFEPSSR